MHAVVKPQAIPFLDLTQEYRALEAQWFEAIRGCGSKGAFVLGQHVSAFEQEAARYLGVAHAVAVANGTDALVLALRALDIGPGDEVITTPFSFFATAEAITHVGATPVFVDIDANFNIDVAAIEARVTAKTRAILPVHLYGQPAAMTPIMALAQRLGLKVLEDCAQAFGADIGGQRVGSFGDAGSFSFYPTKVLGCYGDGGMVVTRDATTAQRLRELRNHGASQPGVHTAIGYNSRLDEIQAALLRIKLAHVDEAIAARRDVAQAYAAALPASVTPPGTVAGNGHVYNVYTVRSPGRDRIRQQLAAQDIASALFYPTPIHLQPSYAVLNYRRGDFPRAERAAAEVLSLPIFPGLSKEAVARVASAIATAV